MRLTPLAVRAVAGFTCSSVIVAAGGRVGPVRGSRPLTDWMGLLAQHSVDPVVSVWPGLVLLLGVLGLVAVWAVSVCSGWLQGPDVRSLWCLAACWAAPLALGPPLLSSDVFSYAAQGRLVVAGYDPYLTGPGALAGSAAAAAVDPRWRTVPSPYGPLTTAIEHASAVVAQGSPLGGVVFLRLVALLAFVAVGALAVAFAPPMHHRSAAALTLLNPLLLLQVVSAAHLEGLLGVLLLGALLAVRRGQPYLGLALACAAGAVKAPGLVCAAAIACWIWQDAQPAKRPAVALRCLVVAGFSWWLLAALAPNGWGWLRALGTPGLGHTPLAPASLLANGLAPVFVGLQGASYHAVEVGCRLATLVAGGSVVAWLLFTVERRPLPRSVGLALLTVAVSGPVLYPWYLLWGVVCLAPEAGIALRNRLVWLCGLACTLALPGMSNSTTTTVAPVIALAAAGALSLLRRREALPGEPATAAA